MPDIQKGYGQDRQVYGFLNRRGGAEVKSLELKTHVGCRREIPCERCPNLVECVLEAVESFEENRRRVKPEKVVIRY